MYLLIIVLCFNSFVAKYNWYLKTQFQFTNLPMTSSSSNDKDTKRSISWIRSYTLYLLVDFSCAERRFFNIQRDKIFIERRSFAWEMVNSCICSNFQISRTFKHQFLIKDLNIDEKILFNTTLIFCSKTKTWQKMSSQKRYFHPILRSNYNCTFLFSFIYYFEHITTSLSGYEISFESKLLFG